jgi:hypothetical protein
VKRRTGYSSLGNSADGMCTIPFNSPRPRVKLLVWRICHTRVVEGRSGQLQAVLFDSVVIDAGKDGRQCSQFVKLKKIS